MKFYKTKEGLFRVEYRDDIYIEGDAPNWIGFIAIVTLIIMFIIYFIK